MKKKIYMKFIYSFFLIVLMLLLGSIKSEASEFVQVSCGDGVIAKMYLEGSNSYIVIEPESGRTNVEMTDYTENGTLPWVEEEKKQGVLKKPITFKSVIIKDGVSKIGNYAFCGITTIESVNLSEAKSLKTIGEYAFSQTGIEKIEIPSSCEHIGDYAFFRCGELREVNLNAGIKAIGKFAFYKTGIEKIEIPGSCEYINEYAFAECSGLREVNLNEGIKRIGYLSFYKTGIKKIDLPTTCEAIENGAFYECSELITVTLNEGLKKIGNNAFGKCDNLKGKRIAIPISVTEVGDNILPEGMQLVWYDSRKEEQENKSMGNNPKKDYFESGFSWIMNQNIQQRKFYLGEYTIGAYVYYKDEDLYTIEVEPLRDNISYINKKVEYNIKDKLKEKMSIDNTVNCKKIIIKSGINEIGDSVFKEVEATELDMSEDIVLRLIQNEAFYGMKNLQTVKISDESIVEIGSKAFAECTSLKEINLENVKSIGHGAFTNTKLEQVILGENLESLEDEAFMGCNSLKVIKIPNTIKSIGENTFKDCNNLENIIIDASNEELYNSLKERGLESKIVKIENNSYIYKGKLYMDGKLAGNKRYIVTKNEDINFLIDIEVDEENALMEKENYIPYKLTTTKEEVLYIWQSDEKGNLEKVGNTTEYTGFCNGKAYKNGKIVTNTMIALPKGTSIKTDANISTNYEVLEDLKIEEIQAKKDTKDVYVVNEQGQLSNNIFESYTSVLTGDINLDGVVDLLDVIYLNKYLAGLVMLSEYQLKVADCYLDGKVNEEDLMTLTKYVILLIDELPESPESQDNKREFARKENNEFYNEHISKELNELDFVEIAKIVKNKINTQEDISYTERDLEIKELYKDGRFVNGINGSSYIGMCLYQYGIYTQNEDVINYVTKDDGKLTQARLYGITNEEIEDLGWQKLEYTSKDNLIKGDIIVTKEEAQIYSGYGAYSCDSEENVKSTSLVTIIEPGEGKYIIRIQPTEGKCGDEINWKIENKTLTISGRGTMYDYTNKKVPWSASKSKINAVNYKATNELESQIWSNVVTSMQEIKKQSTMTIENMSSYKLVEIVGLLKKEIYNRRCSTTITDINVKEDTISVVFYNGYKMGIDVSKHQGEINWAEVQKAGIDFAIIRDGYGREEHQKDEYFEYNYSKAKELGIPIGVYHFSYANSVEDIEKEVNVIKIWLQGKKFELPIFIDFEGQGVNADDATVTAMAKKYCELMKAAGYNNVGIYTGHSWFAEKRVDLSQLPNDVVTWAARYYSLGDYDQLINHEFYQYDIWQYSEKGTIKGIEGNVDLDIMYRRIY